MKTIFALCLFVLVTACSSNKAQTYPYGMSEREWNELSVKDQIRIRRDHTFYKDNNMELVNPSIEVEGRRAGSLSAREPAREEAKQ